MQDCVQRDPGQLWQPHPALPLPCSLQSSHILFPSSESLPYCSLCLEHTSLGCFFLSFRYSFPESPLLFCYFPVVPYLSCTNHLGNLNISAYEPHVHTCMLSHVQLFVTSWTRARQAPLSMGFSRQEYWSELPFSALGDLPNPGIEPKTPALAGGLFITEPPGYSSNKIPFLKLQ